MAARRFDLNIEKILEDWEVHHAIREVIANAIDEKMLTHTQDIEIFLDEEGRWHIKDYGRGLRHEHLTQKEDEEKLNNPNAIGKFGIGLKDALATFDRNGVKVLLRSRFGDMTLVKAEKHDFKDVVTLHAEIAPPSDPDFVGTEVVLEGVSTRDMDKAKDLFLHFSGERLVEGTEYGQVLESRGDTARVYINGVKAAEEDNFLFSYNITSLTKAIREALNRERSNVGRTAYSDRVKAILTSCQGQEVADRLVHDLKGFESGDMHDELKWIDVQDRAVKILNAQKRVVFLTPGELINEAMMVDEARMQGYDIVTVPSNLKERVHGARDISGAKVRDLEQFHLEYLESFEFEFVTPEQLNTSERRMFDATEALFGLVGGKPKQVREVKISETMRKDLGLAVDADGLWERQSGRIIIKRSALASLDGYCGTLLHEAAHAQSRAEDVSREFELELTRLTGLVAAKALELKGAVSGDLRK